MLHFYDQTLAITSALQSAVYTTSPRNLGTGVRKTAKVKTRSVKNVKAEISQQASFHLPAWATWQKCMRVAHPGAARQLRKDTQCGVGACASTSRAGLMQVTQVKNGEVSAGAEARRSLMPMEFVALYLHTILKWIINFSQSVLRPKSHEPR